MAERSFRDGMATLGRMGLSFDAWLYHPQIDELAQLEGSFPDTRMVLNHLGTPLGIGAYTGKRQDVFPRWAASIKALAAHQNVSIKLGGFGMESFSPLAVDGRQRASVWLCSLRIVRIASRPTHTQPAEMLSRWKSPPGPPLNHATELATRKAGTASPVMKE